MKRVSPKSIPSSIDYGADPDECIESAAITFYGMGDSDNCTEEMSNPNYGEVYLNEITEEELEGICHGQGNGDGAGLPPMYDVFDDLTDDEIIDLERFFCGDVYARIFNDEYKSESPLLLSAGSGDGKGLANGGGNDPMHGYFS